MLPSDVVQASDLELRQRLAHRALELVNIPSVSRNEANLLAFVADWAQALKTFEVTIEPGQGALVEQRHREGKPLVVLAGHLDTVPEQGNLPGWIEGDILHGLGASDMKGSLALMIELAEWVERERPDLGAELALLFFAREELSVKESAVPALFARCPRLREACLVIVMEPTDGALQIGCLGNVNAELVFEGKSAHSARPWHGVNALHKAIAGLQQLANIQPEPVRIGDLTYTEVLNLTQIKGGIAQNVIPDRVTCHLNYRYAPNRTPAGAEARLRSLIPEGASLSITGNAPPARAAIDNPLVERMRRLGDLPVEPKQAWTPVAEFSAQGLDAINFGPGATRYAHQRDEQLSIPDMVRGYRLLQRFLVEH